MIPLAISNVWEVAPNIHDITSPTHQSQLGVSAIYRTGAVTLAWALGGVIGPSVAGTLYDLHHWNAYCFLLTGLMASQLPFVLLYTGDRPLWSRMMGRVRGEKGLVRGEAEGDVAA